MTVSVGDAAPDFTLFSGPGETVTLSELKGKKVVLAFFPAAFTGICTKEMCTFQDSLAQLNDLNATVLAISVDNVFSSQTFKKQNNIDFPVLSDYAREATLAYGVALEDFVGVPGYTVAQRAVFIVDTSGNVAYAWEGPNPGHEPNYDEVKAAVAAAS